MGISWDDGGEYARAAEAAGVDVGGMLEAGVDAKQLLEFVAAFRKEEGACVYHPACSWLKERPLYNSSSLHRATSMTKLVHTHSS